MTIIATPPGESPGKEMRDFMFACAVNDTKRSTFATEPEDFTSGQWAEISEICAKAAEILEKDGWVCGLWLTVDNRSCVMGAVEKAAMARHSLRYTGPGGTDQGWEMLHPAVKRPYLAAGSLVNRV